MPDDPSQEGNRYERILRHIFLRGYSEAATSIEFTRDDLIAAAAAERMELPRNLGDVTYAFRHRGLASAEIARRTPAGMEWRLRGKGRSLYAFELVPHLQIRSGEEVEPVLIPDSTPELISSHARDDEQALLAKLRYNRLIDLFLGITAYSLQNHWRTTVSGIGQVEIDEVYVGIDGNGCQYIVPVQAKGRNEELSALQAENDIKCCEEKYPSLVCRPVSALFMGTGELSLFELGQGMDGLRVVGESRFRLVRATEIGPDTLRSYRERSSDE